MKAGLARLAQTALGLLALAFSLSTLAQPYPNKPLRLLIGTAPGGGTDAIGRVVGDALSSLLKVPVVPDNRAGASSQIASEAAAKAPPDGYTVMLVQNAHVTNPAFLKKLPYDTLKDFTAIAPIATSPLVLVSSSVTGVKSWAEFVAQTKRDPSLLSFAVAESSARMAVEQISESIGLKTVSIAYKGTGPAATDVAGGHVNYSVTTIAAALPFKGTGKINFLAVLGKERSPFVPEVPTLAEQGEPNIEVNAWWGMVGPANMPPAIVQKLSTAIRTALEQPEVRAKIHTVGAEPWLGTPADLDRFVQREIPSILRLAKKAGIEPE